MDTPTGRLAAYEARRAELAGLDDAALKDRFWTLAGQVVAPIVDLARTHTSPSIERSVLLRMGIDSPSTHGLVDRIAEHVDTGPPPRSRPDDARTACTIQRRTR